MTTYLLLAGAATALASTPALGQKVDATLTFENNVETSIVTDVNFAKNVDMEGVINIDGDIDVDSAAVAITDTKQILDGNAVVLDGDDFDPPSV